MPELVLRKYKGFWLTPRLKLLDRLGCLLPASKVTLRYNGKTGKTLYALPGGGEVWLSP